MSRNEIESVQISEIHRAMVSTIAPCIASIQNSKQADPETEARDMIENEKQKGKKRLLPSWERRNHACHEIIGRIQ